MTRVMGGPGAAASLDKLIALYYRHASAEEFGAADRFCPVSVSYTHLTLTTFYSV